MKYGWSHVTPALSPPVNYDAPCYEELLGELYENGRKLKTQSALNPPSVIYGRLFIQSATGYKNGLCWSFFVQPVKDVLSTYNA